MNVMNGYDKLAEIVPIAPDYVIDWKKIEFSLMSPFYEKMKKTQQNPEFHAEGDVWKHTKMVCECLVNDSEFRSLQRRQQQELFLASVLHDVGKIYTTKLENGSWTSPYHSIRGANVVRDLLWREYGLCGTHEFQVFRETICLLVRYHMTPSHILESERSEQKLIKIASNGELIPDFDLNMLLILSAADNNGRLFAGKKQREEDILLVRELADELEYLNAPRKFSDSFTEFAYLSGKQKYPDSQLFNDTEFEAVIICGLPGTGKDTFIQNNYPDYFVVSLDDIRSEFGISPLGNQKEVVRIANERAAKLMRKKQSFVWNATSVTPDIAFQTKD